MNLTPPDETTPPARLSLAEPAAGYKPGTARPDAARPWFRWRPSGSPWHARFLWSWLLVASALMLGVGWHLEPDPRGHGTHEQMGLAPCGFYLATGGLPCPTCGATTAFSWMCHLHPWMAVRTHPFGAVAALGTAALLALSIAGIVKAAVPDVQLTRRATLVVAVAVVAILVGSWMYRLGLAMLDRWG